MVLTFATNTIVLFGEAREDARKLDFEFSESGRLKGPLHGVPISVKDSCASPFSLLASGLLLLYSLVPSFLWNGRASLFLGTHSDERVNIPRIISSQHQRFRQYDWIHAMGERSSRARRRRTFHPSPLFIFHSIPAFCLTVRLFLSVVTLTTSRSSRRCAQQAPSSSLRRTSHRRCSPLRVRIRSGAGRATHGQPRTLRVAPPAEKVRCSA
jgi:hypothetical protein